MSYDTKCYDLAKAFLDDVLGLAQWPAEQREEHYQSLAQIIQNEIEDYIAVLETPQ